ncbi:GntR family transcriptional regulator [Streptomyces goshikiensis]|uniref:GntR family transcriptional regulator n=1 Tax=Streptomyces goshikiensis TaxID=1942 RepID=UPI003665B42D
MTRPMPSRRDTIADDLRRQITTGRFKAGERLPSEAQLATRYTVSTPTLRTALAQLQGEGLVEKIHGSGNFVRHHRHRITYLGGAATVSACTALSEPLRVTARATNLWSDDHLTGLLSVPPRSPLTELLFVAHEGEMPHSLARVYVPSDLVPPDLTRGPTSPQEMAVRLAELRPRLAEVQEKASARLPTQDEATALRISTSMPVLSLTRVATDSTGRVVEAALLLFPGDRADALFTTQVVTEERGVPR